MTDRDFGAIPGSWRDGHVDVQQRLHRLRYDGHLRQRGTCVIAATQAGNDWAPAAKVTQSFQVTRSY